MTPDQTCSTCIHWTASGGMHECALARSQESPLMRVDGDHGYPGSLTTTADFGCVLHEAAPDDT